MFLKIALSVIFFFHGFAHLGGVMAPFTKDNAGFKNAPWLFSEKIFLVSSIGRFWAVLWLMAAAGYMASAFGFFFGAEWVQRILFISAIYSLAAMVPWWRAVPQGAKAGMVFDTIVIVFLIVSERVF